MKYKDLKKIQNIKEWLREAEDRMKGSENVQM